MRTAVVTVALFACACGAKSREPAQPAQAASSAQPSSPPATDAETSSGGGDKPVGTQLVRDATSSKQVFTISKDDGSGHGLGQASLMVDGRNVWPPAGPGCPELVRCCTELARDEAMALSCLLATGRGPDCTTALRTSVAIAAENNIALPAACPR